MSPWFLGWKSYYKYPLVKSVTCVEQSSGMQQQALVKAASLQDVKLVPSSGSVVLQPSKGSIGIDTLQLSFKQQDAHDLKFPDNVC